ncbi:MAG: hypothetical protein AAF959_28960 [Cyanobacteria bacterium P01_D01_bin.56]
MTAGIVESEATRKILLIAQIVIAAGSGDDPIEYFSITGIAQMKASRGAVPDRLDPFN